MNFMPSQLFVFVEKNKLKSEFKGAEKIAQLMNIEWSDQDGFSLDPEDVFKSLAKSVIDLDLIQVFVLMGWESSLWKTVQAKQVMKNWWLSALKKDNQGESTLKKVMVLRAVLADTERYPAPTNVIQLMRKTLLELLDTTHWRADQTQTKILKALIAEDAKSLAHISLERKKTASQAVLGINLPNKLPIIQEANLSWLELWIQLNKTQRQSLRVCLNTILNKKLILENQIQFAKTILNHHLFSKQIDTLSLEVKNYPELVAWLSACARKHEFKTKLNLEEIKRLNSWIGTGNYESLREILMEIANDTEDENSVVKTINRYIFWKNYQDFMQEAWLLLPPILYEKNKTNLANVKEIHGTKYPIVVLKIKNYFVLQYFLGTASENNLLMTDDILQIEKILNQNIVYEDQLQKTNLVLIHDHVFMWQSDLAYSLDQFFAIPAHNRQVYFAEGKNNFSEYLKQVKQSDFIHERKQWKNLPQWVKTNLKSKYPTAVYERAALTAKRYGLLD